MRRARLLARHAARLRGLPPRVALFQLRAFALALRAGDEFALTSATRPADVRELLALARGRRRVVELGTATAWTTAALVLADARRRVRSFDPVVQQHRERYVALLPDAARARMELVQAAGVDGAAAHPEPVDLLFVDSTHTRDDTVAELEAWRPRLAPGAVVVLHDYANPAYPGVAGAVADLDLHGEVRQGMYVWRPGGAS